jgi:hypothetical protein
MRTSSHLEGQSQYCSARFWREKPRNFATESQLERPAQFCQAPPMQDSTAQNQLHTITNTDNHITGLKYFDELGESLWQVHDVGCERDRSTLRVSNACWKSEGGLRTLHGDCARQRCAGFRVLSGFGFYGLWRRHQPASSSLVQTDLDNAATRGLCLSSLQVRGEASQDLAGHANAMQRLTAPAWQLPSGVSAATCDDPRTPDLPAVCFPWRGRQFACGKRPELQYRGWLRPAPGGS